MNERLDESVAKQEIKFSDVVIENIENEKKTTTQMVRTLVWTE